MTIGNEQNQMRPFAGIACTIAGWMLLVAFLLSLLGLLPALVIVAVVSTSATAAMLCILTPAILLAASLALIQAGRMLSRPVLRPGHCRACDYDLRGTRHARCPECGTNV